MNSRCDYKPVSPRQRRRAARRQGLLVIVLILIGLFGGLLAYIRSDRGQEPLVAAAPPVAPVTAPAPVAPVSAVPESFKSKYDFYTELPKRQVGIH